MLKLQKTVDLKYFSKYVCVLSTIFDRLLIDNSELYFFDSLMIFFLLKLSPIKKLYPW